MRNMDMKLHKVKLGLIRNRLLIIYSAFLFLWVFSFVMGFLVLARIENLAQEIREGQKGNTCILLIQPQERTREKAIDCIEKNKETPSEEKFKFDTADDPPSNSIISPENINLDNKNLISYQAPLETNDLDDNKSTITPTTDDLSAPYLHRQVTKRINSLGQLECLYEGATAWVIGGDCK